MNKVTHEHGIGPLYYNDRKNPNLFSKWYPHIKDCDIDKGYEMRVPQSKIIRVPEPVFNACYDPNPDIYPDNYAIISKWVKDKLVPLMQPDGEYFCKNGCFSNKFDFKYCISGRSNILDNFIAIQYASLCLETGGVSEFVLRQIIPTAAWDKTIYSGMPLRPEFRVFYDFTIQKPLYIVNYWDYEYCAPSIYDADDKKVFDEMRGPLSEMYEAYKERALDVIRGSMQYVLGLDGIWSIDLMMDDLEAFWLIDMAIGRTSAYYDKNRIIEAGGIL